MEYKLSLLGEQMQGARRDADQMRSAIGSLTRGVAHEIKNPLNAISLRLETLRMKIAGEVPDAESDIDLVSNEVQRLDRVVRTFLDLNRPMELEIMNSSIRRNWRRRCWKTCGRRRRRRMWNCI